MATNKTKDGTEIYYKDWGSGQPIVFHHGWPLSADDWDNQMLFFLARAIASSPMTVAATAGRPRPTTATTWTPTPPTSPHWPTHLDLKDAIHVGHSTGGGEVARYVARHGRGRVAKAALISAVPPIMVKTRDESQRHRRSRCSTTSARQLAANRAQFYRDVPAGPVLRLQPAGREGLARASSRTGGARA